MSTEELIALKICWGEYHIQSCGCSRWQPNYSLSMPPGEQRVQSEANGWPAFNINPFCAIHGDPACHILVTTEQSPLSAGSEWIAGSGKCFTGKMKAGCAKAFNRLKSLFVR